MSSLKYNVALDLEPALEKALRDKRVMAETLARCVDRCTKQETVIREFRRLVMRFFDYPGPDSNRELVAFLDATKGGRLP